MSPKVTSVKSRKLSPRKYRQSTRSPFPKGGSDIHRRLQDLISDANKYSPHYLPRLPPEIWNKILNEHRFSKSASKIAKAQRLMWFKRYLKLRAECQEWVMDHRLTSPQAWTKKDALNELIRLHKRFAINKTFLTKSNEIL